MHTWPMDSTQQFVLQVVSLGIAALAVLASIITLIVTDRRARLNFQFQRFDGHLREQRGSTAEIIRLGSLLMSDVHTMWDAVQVDHDRTTRITATLNQINRLSLELQFLTGGGILGAAAESYMIELATLIRFVEADERARQDSTERFDENIASCLKSGRRLYAIGIRLLVPSIAKAKAMESTVDDSSIDEALSVLERQYDRSEPGRPGQ